MRHGRIGAMAAAMAASIGLGVALPAGTASQAGDQQARSDQLQQRTKQAPIAIQRRNAERAAQGIGYEPPVRPNGKAASYIRTRGHSPGTRQRRRRLRERRTGIRRG